MPDSWNRVKRVLAGLSLALLVLGIMAFSGQRSSVATAASASLVRVGLTKNQVANGTIPAGMCEPSMPAVRLTGGSGSTGANAGAAGYFSIRLLSGPLLADFNHDGATDAAVVIVCGSGGSLQWTSLWLLDSRSGHLTALAGPLYRAIGGRGRVVRSPDHVHLAQRRIPDRLRGVLAGFRRSLLSVGGKHDHLGLEQGRTSNCPTVACYRNTLSQGRTTPDARESCQIVAAGGGTCRGRMYGAVGGPDDRNGQLDRARYRRVGAERRCQDRFCPQGL